MTHDKLNSRIMIYKNERKAINQKKLLERKKVQRVSSALPHRLLVRRWPLLLHSLLQRQQLLRPERLIVDLSSRFNQILQVRPRQKVAQMHKLAVLLIFHVHHPPAVLPATHRFAVNDHTAFGSNYSERNNVL